MRVGEKDIRIQGRAVRIAALEGDGYVFLDDPEAVLAELRKCGARIDLFTFLQKLPEAPRRYGYPMEWDNLAVLPVSTFEHWWNEQIGFKARNKAKQAEKRGVVVREVAFDEGLVRGIWEIYNETPVRQGKRFPHYGRDLEAVEKMSATFLDQSIFMGALFEGSLIGFAKLVTDEGQTQAGLMHILSMNRHRDKSPTNALIAQAVRSCADRGIPHLVYSKFAYGKRLQSSLGDFKERNGFVKIMIPRYYVPLTPVGRVALACGLHRGVQEWTPEPVAAVYRKIRSSWYARKFPGLENA